MRFLVFRYDAFYPGGAFNDLEGAFETLVEAQQWATDDYTSFGPQITEIYDTQTGQWWRRRGLGPWGDPKEGHEATVMRGSFIC